MTRGEIGVAVLCFLVSLLSIALTRNASGASLLWPANAMAAAFLLRNPSLRLDRVFIAVLLGATLVNVLVEHDAPFGSLALSSVDLLEVAATVYLFRRIDPIAFPKITFTTGLRMLVLLGVVIPAAISLPGGLAVYATFGIPLWSAALGWYTATAAGAILCAPSIYLYSSKAWQRLVARDVLAGNFALAVGCLLVTYLSIRFSRFPLVTLSLPLIVLAFRVGAFGAALMCEAVGIFVVVLWAWGVRLPGAPAAAMQGVLVDLPFVALAAIMVSPIMMGLAADDRERAMRALRYNEQRFRQSLRHSPLGVMMRDLTGKMTMANDAFLEMLGYTWEEMSHLTTEQLMHPDDQQKSNHDMRTLIEGKGDTYTAERRYRHRDGSWVWTRVAVSLVTDDDGVPIHFIGHVESLEARRRAERDLAEERERLRTTLRAIADAVITTDAVGQITYVNEAAENLIGQRFDAIAGRRLDEVVVLTNQQTLKATQSMFALCLARATSVKRSERCLLHRPDGTPCYVLDAASPVHDSEGAISGVVVVLQDATAGVERDLELNRRASQDPLTGLTNRFELERHLSECFERYRHIQRAATLLLIDLDRFKQVNDTGGHAAGDEVLRQVARTLVATVRDSDIVCRLGGDEFAILLTRSDPTRADLVGGKVLRAISALTVDVDGRRHTVGASIGAASLGPGISNLEEWVAAADGACYEAKRAGRGQMRIVA
jgi:diguanylate cyclase (GGDEF)-like protein/PAS domain S-box-containing protein